MKFNWIQSKIIGLIFTSVFPHILFLFISSFAFGQQTDFISKIDSLITAKSDKPFNGIILISQNGITKYLKINGYSDIENKIPLQRDAQFVIGSISEQVTAVIVLQEYDKGHLKLDVPIRLYLPELTQSWADTVTIHQLLTHTHGITALDKPLAFVAGTQYSYSQIGYQLLASIVELTSKESFAELSARLFDRCGMKNTSHPDLHKHMNLVNGYTEQENGGVTIEKDYFHNYTAAGGFISSVDDMNLWNVCLHTQKLLSDKTYQMMVTKQKNAIRDHPIFGTTYYGYGITIDTKDNILQYGQTGFAPGFVSMNFYFPESKTSIVVFENIVWNEEDIDKTFYYHIQILKLYRNGIDNSTFDNWR